MKKRSVWKKKGDTWTAHRRGRDLLVELDRDVLQGSVFERGDREHRRAFDVKARTCLARVLGSLSDVDALCAWLEDVGSGQSSRRRDAALDSLRDFEWVSGREGYSFYASRRESDARVARRESLVLGRLTDARGREIATVSALSYANILEHMHGYFGVVCRSRDAFSNEARGQAAGKESSA